MMKAIYFGPYSEMSSGGVGNNILKMRMLQVKKHPHSKMILSNRRYPMKYLISDVCGICLSDTGMK